MAKRWLRRALVAPLVLVTALAGGLAVTAALLPADGTERILELRGGYGGVEEHSIQRGPSSTVALLGLHNDRGEEVTSAWVRRPATLAPDYRVLLTYAGARTDERILGLIPESDDLVLVAVQYPFDAPRTARAKARAPYDIRQAAYRTVAGGLLAVDYLETDAGLDADRILLVGASLGSFFATLHGALDTRLPEVVLVHGGAELSPVLERAMASRTPAWLLPTVVRLARIPIDTFEPGRYVARISPRPLVMIADRNDRHFPAEAVEAFFERAREPKTLRWTETGHVGSAKPDIVEVILAEIAAYLEETRAQERVTAVSSG
jgi:dienelactone hydrolase